MAELQHYSLQHSYMHDSYSLFICLKHLSQPTNQHNNKKKPQTKPTWISNLKQKLLVFTVHVSSRVGFAVSSGYTLKQTGDWVSEIWLISDF